jgi:hypothetical protein
LPSIITFPRHYRDVFGLGCHDQPATLDAQEVAMERGSVSPVDGPQSHKWGAWWRREIALTVGADL